MMSFRLSTEIDRATWRRLDSLAIPAIFQEFSFGIPFALTFSEFQPKRMA